MRQRKSDEIVLDIKRTILSGAYSPGDKLPSERELSQHYNVSRIPVREAIAQLVQEQIIRTESNVGNFIADTCDSHLLSNNILQYSLLDHKLLHESLLARQLVEAEAARLAAQNATKDDIEDIQKYLFSSTGEFTKLKSKERNQFFKEDFHFHSAIAKASHSDFHIAYMNSIRETISIHQFSSQQRDATLSSVPDAHFRIFNAILSKNPDVAAKEMTGHLQWVLDIIEAKSL